MATQFTPIVRADTSIDVYCPVCGQVIIAGGNSIPQCPHVLFVYVEGEFVHVKSTLAKDALRVVREDDSDGNPAEALLKAVGDESCLGLAVTIEGMACGPVSETAWVAIAFWQGGRAP